MCNHKKKHSKTRARLTRRDVVRYGIAAGAGIAALGPFGGRLLPKATGTPLPNHRRCVVLYCYGGYDGLNMLVPTAGEAVTPYTNLRPTIAITSGTHALNGIANFELNPNLDNMAALYNQGDGAIFQKVGYPSQNLSHFTSQDIYSEGVRNGFGGLPIQESGWIARFADLYAPTPLGAVSVGVGKPLDFVGGTSNPFLVDSLNGFEFDVDGDYPANHQHRLSAVQDILSGYTGGSLDEDAATALEQGLALTVDIQDAVDNFTPPAGQQYPNSSPGRYMKDIATLIQHGTETRMFFTGFSGWDTHGNEIAGMNNRCTRLDDAVGAFAGHMQEMGLWDDTLILVVSEFGRRNFENGSFGTDHGHGNCFFAFGGTVNSGYYGNELTAAELTLPNNNWLGYDIDFRDIYKEMIDDHFAGLGTNSSLIFPEPQDINTNLNYITP